MSKLRSLALSAAAFLASAGSGFAAVDVSFDKTESYTDAVLSGGYGSRARAATLNEIKRHLEGLGNRYLASNQTLKLEVLDIDLAGQHQPWRARAYDVRIMRDVTWPLIRLRYVLQQDGNVLRQGEEAIRDMEYLSHGDAGLRSDPLRYEKAMLSDWFARFTKDQPRD